MKSEKHIFNIFLGYCFVPLKPLYLLVPASTYPFWITNNFFFIAEESLISHLKIFSWNTIILIIRKNNLNKELLNISVFYS